MADRQEPIRRSSSGGQSNSRRTDVIRCERCGEDYSVTYKRCPFCDERPGKRVARNTRGGGYGGAVNPIQVVGLVISLVLIIAALFIVFTKVAPLFHRNPGSSSGSQNTSQSQGKPSGTHSGSSTGSGTSGSGTANPPSPTTVQAISLDKTDFTLEPNASQQLSAAVSPSGTTEPVTWSSSNPAAATVDANGNVVNVHTGSSTAVVEITASCGGQNTTCIVRCKPSSGTTQPSGGNASAGSRGTIVNAEKGLNIRSGPGREHDVIASAKNGATVTILENAGNGWYKIDYGNGKVGYVSSDYVSVR